uniref:Ig-like domain-containing protein n=1 Tax=Denticeps clupeoides TaxID=299321 RepID=A0AAY4CIG4_9TELE
AMKFCGLFIVLCGSQAFLLAPSGAGRDRDWQNVILIKPETNVTLSCEHKPVLKYKLNWKVKLEGAKHWSLVLSINEKNISFGEAASKSTQMADQNFQRSGNFSLQFLAQTNNAGLYSCVVDQGNESVKEKVTLLAFVELTVTPSIPVPYESILRLRALVVPPYALYHAAWYSPTQEQLSSEKVQSSGVLLTKLPCFLQSDQGNYTFQARLHGNSPQKLFLFPITVTANTNKCAIFSDISQHGADSICCSYTTVIIPCGSVLGDYIQLFWKEPRAKEMKPIYKFDRWRQSSMAKTDHQLQLVEPTSQASGNFYFLLTPKPTDGGVYQCEVFLDDTVFIQAVKLTVIHVFAKSSNSELVLSCIYSEHSQVQSVMWTHQNDSQQVHWDAKVPGQIRTRIPLPVNDETSGMYICTVKLLHGQSASAVYNVTASPKGILIPKWLRNKAFLCFLCHSESHNVSAVPLLPPLFALLLLVPVAAVVAGVLLWRREKRVEQSLSYYSGEVENIYENPDDLRHVRKM